MLTILAIAHIFVGFALILFVLLQDPKGGAMGVFSGGSSSSSFFGSSGASNFLTATTKWLAILFAVSCLALTYLSTHKGEKSVMDSYNAPAAPAAPVDGAAKTTPADTTTPAAADTATPPADSNKQ